MLSKEECPSATSRPSYMSITARLAPEDALTHTHALVSAGKSIRRRVSVCAGCTLVDVSMSAEYGDENPECVKIVPEGFS